MHKRVLIPLPDYEARAQILRQEMGDPVNWELLDDEEIDEIVLMLEGYSGSDIKTICIDALNIPLEEAGRSEYFIKLQGEDGEFYYTPCHELVEGAIRIAFGDVPDKKLQIRPTSSVIVQKLKYSHFKLGLPGISIILIISVCISYILFIK